MKKYIYILALMLAMPVSGIAQSWEVPVEVQQNKTTKKSKKAEHPKDMNKYLAGAVPFEDGVVRFSYDIKAEGKTAQQVYDLAYEALQSLTKQEQQTEKSRIALVNKSEYSIIAQMDEWLIFKNSILVLDRTEFLYKILVECRDGGLKLSMERLNYAYCTDRNDGFRLHAEELITDKQMLTKDGKNLKKRNSKFRIATIDRIEEIRAYFIKALQ